MNNYLTAQDFLFLSPLIILLIGALILLLVECFVPIKAKGTPFFITLVTFFLAFLGLNYSPSTSNEMLTDWIKADELSDIFTNLFLIIGFISACFAATFFKKFEKEKLDESEYYFLLIASVFGLILIGISADFLTLFLGLETLSIALYVLCGYVKNWAISKESAIKYFLIGSLGTAFLLYGIALIYGAIGTTNFSDLMLGYQSIINSPEKMLFLSGIAFVSVGLLFKVTIVPFHTWAPDVYEGATTPVTAFMAVGTKIGAFAAFIRIFLEALPQFNTIWNEAIAILFFPTVIYANLVAIRQTNLRRFFAYSGISHAGYLLIPLSAGTQASIPAMLFYLFVYLLSTFGAFAVLAVLDTEKRGLRLNDLKGLFYRSPFLASILALSILTLAGIPPTVGFFAKFYIFKVGFDAGYYALVVAGLVMTVFSAYYYLWIISGMLTRSEVEVTSGEVVQESSGICRCDSTALIGGILFVSMIIFSILPGSLIDLFT